MDDRRLWQLIEKLREELPESLEWRRSMNELLYKIQRLPGLKRSSHPDYLDALNQTYEWVWKNIQSFELSSTSVQKSLVTWVNSYLRWRINDLYLEEKKTKILSLDVRVSDDELGLTLVDELPEKGCNPASFSWLEKYIEHLDEQETQRIWLLLEQAIDLDPQGRLKALSTQARSGCNCKFLSQKLLLQEPPDSLALLARELEINYQTLVSHWRKRCIPCLQKTVVEFNYKLNSEL